jgi:hypothetical protein
MRTRAPRHTRLLGLAVAACVAAAARTQSPGAEAPPLSPFPPEILAPWQEPPAPRSDLAILIWFDGRDPLRTFHHRVYDRRRGQYTDAVNAWRRMVHARYPHYVAAVRYVDVGGRDTAAVVRETVAAERNELTAATTRVRTRSSHHVSPPAPRTRSATRAPHPIGGAGAPGAAGISSGGPPPYTFPVPYPYPRPHP